MITGALLRHLSGLLSGAESVGAAGAQTWHPWRMNSPTDSRSIVVDSPIGSLTLVASSRGLQQVQLPTDGAGGPQAGLASNGDAVAAGAGTETAQADAILAEARRQLSEYFDGGRREFDLPLDLAGTEFQMRAWQALASVGYGQTAAYGEQAERIGKPGAARAVGRANGANPVPIVLPCHRIVGADGSLTGYGGGLHVKQQLLAHERSLEPAG